MATESVIYFLVGLFLSLAVSLKALSPKSSTKGTISTQDRLRYQQLLLSHGDCWNDVPTKYGEITYGINTLLKRNPPNGGCQADE